MYEKEQKMYTEKFAPKNKPMTKLVLKSDGERIHDLVTVVTSLIIDLNAPNQSVLLNALSATREEVIR